VRTTVTLLAAVVLLVVAAPLLAAPASGCIACHTDEAKLKALFTPPKTPAGEGEG
jgi:hypothetical protein